MRASPVSQAQNKTSASKHTPRLQCRPSFSIVENISTGRYLKLQFTDFRSQASSGSSGWRTRGWATHQRGKGGGKAVPAICTPKHGASVLPKPSLESLIVHPVFSLDTAFPQVRESDYPMKSFKIMECPDSWKYRHEKTKFKPLIYIRLNSPERSSFWDNALSFLGMICWGGRGCGEHAGMGGVEEFAGERGWKAAVVLRCWTSR